jgi:hypothetical protein
MALMIWTIHIDAIPAGREKIIHPQPVRTRRFGEIAGVVFAADFRGRGRGTPRRGEAAEGDGLEFGRVGRGAAVRGVADEHAEALARYVSVIGKDGVGKGKIEGRGVRV